MLRRLDTGIWTFVDPVGDASVAVTGSAAQIGVPAGTAHDVWAGVDSVARMLQPVPNADFEVEAKFDQAVTSAFQQQGIFVEQDATDLLRLELHNDGGGTRLFAAAIAGGSATRPSLRRPSRSARLSTSALKRVGQQLDV